MRVACYKGDIESLDWLFPMAYPFVDTEKIMKFPVLFGIVEIPEVLHVCLWPELGSNELWNRYAVGLHHRGRPVREERIISVSEGVTEDFTDAEIDAVLGHEIAHWLYTDAVTDGEVEFKCDACIAAVIGRQPVISALGKVLLDTRRISHEATDKQIRIAAAGESMAIQKRISALE